MVVAVDGYSSTGKSTVAKRIAAKLGLIYIDTGAMYRAVTLHALRMGFIVDGVVDLERLKMSLQQLEITLKYSAESARYETFLNGNCVEEQIRGMEVSENVSPIAALDFVREYLVSQQREMGRKGAVIMDGRDIGSVVFPDADVKFFMTASAQVRAERRYKELKDKGMEVSFEEVMANVQKRDYIDTHRSISPLVQVSDAIVVDNSQMDLEEEVAWMIEAIKAKIHTGFENNE